MSFALLAALLFETGDEQLDESDESDVVGDVSTGLIWLLRF
jgi:hypothetical protein